MYGQICNKICIQENSSTQTPIFLGTLFKIKSAMPTCVHCVRPPKVELEISSNVFSNFNEIFEELINDVLWLS